MDTPTDKPSSVALGGHASEHAGQWADHRARPDIEPGYQSGFANEFATEALPGALPRRPQFAATRGLRPVCRATVGHRVHRAARPQPPLVAVPDPSGGGAPAVHGAALGTVSSPISHDVPPTPPNQLRWDPLPMPPSRPISSTAG